MKISIKADFGYHVRRSKKADEIGHEIGYENPVLLLDGDKVVMIAGKRSYNDFKDELVYGNNECARLCEVFVTTKGNTFAYWRDEEADLDFLTKLEA